jgi:uncharacterized protein YegP (UPF0339 family)
MSSKIRIELVKGTVRWYYRVVAANGERLTTSQKYFSKGNAKRAAKSVAKALNCELVEVS